MKVVIAEKPSVAGDIARVLGATKKSNGYFEGAGYCVTYAYGHLIALADPGEYGFGKWEVSTLPILPTSFVYKPLQSSSTSKQLAVIKQLFSQADEIICATDAGREGEAIFRYIYNHCRCNTPVKRLWISSLTDSAIKEGFSNLKPNSQYDNLYLSAKARNEADWLVGMNATRALTLSNHSSSPLSVGRVQTPTLSLICKRFYENKAFQPTPYYVIKLNLSYNGKQFIAKSVENYQNREFAQNLAGSIPREVSLSDKKEKEVTEKPPLPFDITSLQAEANKKFHFKAQQTLEIVQSLYEKHKMLSYPRTGSRYLGDDMQPEIEKNIDLLKSLRFDNFYLDCLSYIRDNGIITAPFDSSKLTDHHAIIPTFQNIDKYSSLDNNEKKIYELVCRQLIKSLLPACRKNISTYDFKVDENIYRAKGTKILFVGWRMMNEAADSSDDDKEDDSKQTLPAMNINDVANVSNVECSEEFTQKPPLLTEATLLKLMESAGKLISDKEIASAIKDCGLGTPATRAAVIETLFDRKFIRSEKNKLLPTELGLQVYELLKDQQISSPELTGEWEKKLNEIETGKFSVDDFNKEIRQFVTQQVATLLETEGRITTNSTSNLNCPKCGKPIAESQKSWYCSGYKDGCKFSIWKEVNGVKLTTDNIKDLANKQPTKEISGFKNKEGKKFNAALSYDFETDRLKFIFNNQSPVSIGKCPLCGKDIFETARSYSCSGYKDGCKFTVWKEISGKKITKEQVCDILKNGRTQKISGFKSSAGKTFNASLVFNKDEQKLKFEL